MKQNSHLINEITGERIKGEFDKIIKKHGSAKVAFDLLERSDLDKALFGKKFDRSSFKYFEALDVASFYYILGNLGGKNPAKFYKQRLKGEFNVTKALETLDKYFDKFDKNKYSEQEIRWNFFNMIKTSPMVMHSHVLPANLEEIKYQMDAEIIPTKDGDIPVDGNDIMRMFNVKDEEVGRIKNQMYKDALMKEFNWKSRKETIEYLQSL